MSKKIVSVRPATKIFSEQFHDAVKKESSQEDEQILKAIRDEMQRDEDFDAAMAIQKEQQLDDGYPVWSFKTNKEKCGGCSYAIVPLSLFFDKYLEKAMQKARKYERKKIEKELKEARECMRRYKKGAYIFEDEQGSLQCNMRCENTTCPLNEKEK